MTDRISEFLEKAATGPVQLSIHDLLATWGFRYRDFDNVGRIERDLAAARLRCEPSFVDGSMRTVVTVAAISANEADAADQTAASPGADESAPEAAEQDEQLVLPQVAWLVRDVPSATGSIEYIHPSATLEQAQQIMMENGFSQLAVMTGPTELKGAVSWEGIAKARVANASVSLGNAIDRFPKVVYADQELLDQLDVIYAAGFVFVRDQDDNICGIITNADLTSQFADLTIPFYQLGEIERRIRQCISAAFSIEELRRATGRPKLESADNMMFGQYQNLLKDPDQWQRMHWMLDRERFIDHLDKVRIMRNHVMHFGARPLDDSQKNRLTKFLDTMRHLSP
jgi:CBS domain-containing protein